MKKKLFALALGVVAVCSAAFAQIPVTAVINGTPVTGTVVGVMPNSTLTVGTIITITSNLGVFQFQVTTTPSTNPPGNISTAANAIGNAFNAFNVSGSLAGGVNQNIFGSNAGEYSVNYLQQVQVPFDFGISAVLGAGAIAAVKTARRRRKEQEAQAA